MRVFKNERFRELDVEFTAPRDGDAGYDLYALDEHVVLSGDRVLIDTGIHLEIPDGYVGLVKDRSSMAVKGLHTMGGVIDSAYRGEIKVVLHNTLAGPYTVERGQKIAQLVIVPCFTETLQPVDTLEALTATDRGAGGFGSTGE